MESDSEEGSLGYYDMISSYIKEVVLKDTRYVCTDCGRLKNNDTDLSGTLCATCYTTNSSLDPAINNFTSLVRKFQTDIEPALTGEIRGNICIKPSEKETNALSLNENCKASSLSKKEVQYLIKNRTTDQSIQTELSFSPLDDVSFIVKKKLLHTDAMSDSIVEEKRKEEKSKCNQNISSSNSLAAEIHVDIVDDASHEINHSLPRLSDIPEWENFDGKVLMDTEMIESSVNDRILPRTINSSPLLFSQETRDSMTMEDPSDEDGCVDGTPPKHSESTCNWRKGDRDAPKSKSIISSDEEIAVGDKELIIKYNEFQENISGEGIKLKETDKNPMNKSTFNWRKRDRDAPKSKSIISSDEEITVSDEELINKYNEFQENISGEGIKLKETDENPMNKSTCNRRKGDRDAPKSKPIISSDEEITVSDEELINKYNEFQKNKSGEGMELKETDENPMNKSTCNWRKGDRDAPKSKSIISSDEKIAVVDEELINKNNEFQEDISGEGMELKKTDENPMNQYEDKNETKDNLNCTFDSNKSQSSNVQMVNAEDTELTEEQILTQSTQKLSKYNMKIVVSNVEGDDSKHLERFVDLFVTITESDVSQQTDFVIVGVDNENKVLRRTPKFLKAISLHLCIVNAEYLNQCCQHENLVQLERKYIPLDSSGVDGPVRSYIRQGSSLLEKFVFFLVEKDAYLSSLLEFLILQNGGILIANMQLFSAYKHREDGVDALNVSGQVEYTKIFLYGDNDESQVTSACRLKLYTVFRCHCLNYKNLFNCIASYDTAELGL